MKRVLITIAALLSVVTLSSQNNDELKRLLDEINKAISQREVFNDNREKRIDAMKNIIELSKCTSEQLYLINDDIIEEYIPYQFDSAALYLYRNIALAQRMGDYDHLSQSRIKLSYIFSSAGIYLESANQLAKVDTTRLNGRLLREYYRAQHKLNDELRLYSHDEEQKQESYRLTMYYCDRIIESCDTNDNLTTEFRMWRFLEQRDFHSAEMSADTLLSRFDPSTRDYAKVAYMRAIMAGMQQQYDVEQCWYARSAIADIRSATRDNSSLKSLCTTLITEPYIGAAMNYMNIVMNDARFFNSRLRPWQDAQILPLIADAYNQKKERSDSLSRTFIITLILFSLLVVGALIVMLRQNRRLATAHDQLRDYAVLKNDSHEQLEELNKQLRHLNNQITEANSVKEEYIGIFLMACSEYLDRLAELRRNIRRALRENNTAKLQTEYAAIECNDRELDEFYKMFDSTFLRLYPSFIDDFNSLLTPEAHIEPHNSGQLNTELRIFALIRLGITDSSKIAAMLRYSISTIYNYRSKVMCSTVLPRENFEEAVRMIGSFNSHL